MAETKRQALARLTEVLSRITGTTVTLDMQIEPIAVRFRLGDAAPTPVHALPDGLQSLLSWVGDLLMRLDRIPWSEPGPVTDQAFVLLLDEVEVHLHPAWQRMVIPTVERLFPRAQIIASTHSPFVIASAGDAWLHLFHLDADRGAVVDPPRPGALGMSYPAVVDAIMGVAEEFDADSEARLRTFRELWRRRLAGEGAVQAELEAAATELRRRSVELDAIVGAELRELAHRLAKRAG